MALTVHDLLTSVAYRRGESGNPDNATEQARRLRFLNEAYRAVLLKNRYWFTVKTGSDSTKADHEAYDLPADFRDMLEVRIDDIARYPMADFDAFASYRYPPDIPTYDDRQRYYLSGNQIHFLPAPTEDGTNNIAYRYYYWPANPTQMSDTVIIPDQYTDALVAYVFARLAHQDGERGDASDGFEEFNEIVREMNKENMRRGLWGKGINGGEIRPDWL